MHNRQIFIQIHPSTVKDIFGIEIKDIQELIYF